MGTTGRCARTLAGDADQAGPRPSRAAVFAPPAGRGGAASDSPFSPQMISAGAGIAGKSAQLPGSPAYASTSSANTSASVPARLSISQPGDRCGSCPAIHQQDPVPRQRRGVPGEFRSAAPSRVQPGRGLVAAAGTGRAGPAHLIRPHLYRHPYRLPGVPIGRAIPLSLAVDYVRWGGAADGGSGRRDGRRRGRPRAHAGVARRPRAGDRGAEGRVRARSADQGRTRRAGRSGAGREDLRRAGRADRRLPACPGRVRADPPAGPGPAPATGQGGRRVGRLPGPRGRRRVGQLHPRSGRPRRRSLLGWPDGPVGPMGRNRGSVDLVVRGGHFSAATTLWQAVAAPAGAGRPRPRPRTARWHRPWLGSPRPPGRPDLRRSAGSQLTAWSAMSFWTGYPGAPKGTSGTGCRVTGHPRPSASLDPTYVVFNLAPACGRHRRLRCAARRRAPPPHPRSTGARPPGSRTAPQLPSHDLD